MGEYARLNRMIESETERMKRAKAEGDYETAAEIECGIGEIRGALIKMANMDGFDDPYEAFNY